MVEQAISFNLHPPSRFLLLLEGFHIREVEPRDICPENQLPALYVRYPDLLGDQREIDTGLGGKCQSWRDNLGWWRHFIEQVSH